MKVSAPNRPLWVWTILGVLGYLALPWYAQQDANGLLAVGQVWGDAQAANGLLQAAQFGRPWLWLGLVGLAVAAVGAALVSVKPALMLSSFSTPCAQVESWKANSSPKLMPSE